MFLRFLSPFAGQRFPHFPQYSVAFCCCFVHPYKSLFNPCSFFACPHYKLLCHLFLVGFSSWSPAFTLHAIRVFSAPALLMAIWRLFSWPQPLACPMGLKGAWMPPAAVRWCWCTHPSHLSPGHDLSQASVSFMSQFYLTLHCKKRHNVIGY